MPNQHSGVMTEVAFAKLMNATMHGPLPITTVTALCGLTGALLEERKETRALCRRYRMAMLEYSADWSTEHDEYNELVDDKTVEGWPDE